MATSAQTVTRLALALLFFASCPQARATEEQDCPSPELTPVFLGSALLCCLPEPLHTKERSSPDSYTIHFESNGFSGKMDYGIGVKTSLDNLSDDPQKALKLAFLNKNPNGSAIAKLYWSAQHDSLEKLYLEVIVQKNKAAPGCTSTTAKRILTSATLPWQEAEKIRYL